MPKATRRPLTAVSQTGRRGAKNEKTRDTAEHVANGRLLGVRCRFCGAEPDAAVTRRWEFLLPIRTPSQNDLASNRGGARHRYRRARNEFELEFLRAAAGLRIPHAMRRRRVTLTRLFSGRERKFDYGNLVGGCKLVLDAMIRAWLIVDDAPKWLEDHYLQVRGSESGLLVIIEEFAEKTS